MLASIILTAAVALSGAAADVEPRGMAEGEAMAIILPACEFEDSDNCFWDAAERGNGEGVSFYVIDGEVIYLG